QGRKKKVRYILMLTILLCGFSDQALALVTCSQGKCVITGSNGPIQIPPPNNTNTVVNKGTITGGPSTGLTTTNVGTVVNKGTITGTTGLSVSGSSSSVINTGTIQGYSSNRAVGISQVP